MNITIALCGACGAPRPEGLARLAEADRGVEVWWAADLCMDPGSLRKLFESRVEYLIVLGASEPEKREMLYEAARAGGLHPLNLDFVDVPVPATRAACEAVLRAARAAVRDFRDVDERHVKPTVRVRGAMTRRSFLRGMRPSATVAIPRIVEERCRSRTGCELCLSACPSRALEVHGRIVRLRAVACTGCDRCVAACPTGAMDNPFEAYARLRSRVEAWAEATPARPRRLVLTCTPSAIPALRSLRRTKAPGAFFQEIPCLGALRAHEYLDLLTAGIDQVVFVRDGRACEPSQQCWDPMPKALALASEARVLRDRFVEATPDELPAVLHRPVPPMDRSRNGPPFKSLHEAVAWAADSQEGRLPIRGRGAGFVEIRADRCTGCLVCRDRCPTSAIFAPESGGFKIDFRHAMCDACGICEATCPEGAIVLHREIRFEFVGRLAPLYSDEWSLCRRCGAQIAPRRMLVELAERIGRPVDSFELCPECRLAFSGEILRAEPAESSPK